MRPSTPAPVSSLMPVGKFNLLHDSPLNDLVDRPMVSRIIIPSTWFEAGAGIYGTLYPSYPVQAGL